MLVISDVHFLVVKLLMNSFKKATPLFLGGVAFFLFDNKEPQLLILNKSLIAKTFFCLYFN